LPRRIGANAWCATESQLGRENGETATRFGLSMRRRNRGKSDASIRRISGASATASGRDPVLTPRMSALVAVQQKPAAGKALAELAYPGMANPERTEISSTCRRIAALEPRKGRA
jgi:hypothetical protein